MLNIDIFSKNPSKNLLLSAYVFMALTFVTGLLWVLSVLIAWQLRSKTDDPFEKLHCQWILKSNIVFILGVLISLLLFWAALANFSSESIPAFIAGLMGCAIIACTCCWYFYRTVRGIMALFGSSMLPNAK